MFSALEAVTVFLLLNLEVRLLCCAAEIAVGATEKARVDRSVETQLNQARDVTTFISSVVVLLIFLRIFLNTFERKCVDGGSNLNYETFAIACLGLMFFTPGELTQNGR
jgi:hypothetical protein